MSYAQRAAARAAAVASGIPMKWSPSPKHRDYLYRWPAGVTRESAELWKLAGMTRDTAGNMEAAGYITVVNDPSNPAGWVSKFTATRTERPIRPYKPLAVKPAYKGDYPWSLNDHWQRMCDSPSRISIIIAGKLTGKHVYFGSRSADDKLEALMFVTTKAELNTVRHLLLQLCGRDAQGNWRGARRTHGNFGRLEPLLVTGVGMRLLCLDMLVEPVIEILMPSGCAQFKGFRALDPDAALAELQQLGGQGGSLLEKYRTYMEGK